MTNRKLTVVDLFSGAGGMSYGFKAHGGFDIIAAADAEIGKPTAGAGKLQCISTYQKNIGIVRGRVGVCPNANLTHPQTNRMEPGKPAFGKRPWISVLPAAGRRRVRRGRRWSSRD